MGQGNRYKIGNVKMCFKVMSIQEGINTLRFHDKFLIK